MTVLTARHRALVTTAALLVGVVLLVVTLIRADLDSLGQVIRQLGAGLPLALAPGAAWHLLRTEAWRQCFPPDRQPSFARLFRVRLAAEAFSFVTIRGVAGEPLKVVLLDRDATAKESAAAVALERLAYIVITAVITAAAALVALAALPLTRPWVHIFRGVALGGGALAVAAIVLLTRLPRDRARMWRVAALEAASFGMMALEVWVVLRIAATPISAIGAFAIETFTRVASMASAFIPGNLGALEASNVAAAAAVNAAGGAAALALVRRIRGLLWCAAGFAIYPHRKRGTAPFCDLVEPKRGRTPFSRASTVLIVTDDSNSEVTMADRLAGMPMGERTLRAAARAGCTRVLVWTPRQLAAWQSLARRMRRALDVVAVSDAAAWREEMARLGPHAHVTVTVPGIATRSELAEAERRLRASIVKPTDGPLGLFNRRMSIPISVALIRWTRCSANVMSIAVLPLGLYAGWLFSRGNYAAGVFGALASWAASVLDGCDGELARLQFKESAFGCWLDTLGDYVYYIAIFGGLTIGAARQTGSPVYWWLGGALVCGTLLTCALLIVLRRRITQGRPEELRTAAKAHFYGTGKWWAAFVARLSNCATRATMPYGIVAFAVAGVLPAVVILGAVGAQIYWISLAIELRNLLDKTGPHGEDKAKTPCRLPVPTSNRSSARAASIAR